MCPLGAGAGAGEGAAGNWLCIADGDRAGDVNCVGAVAIEVGLGIGDEYG